MISRQLAPVIGLIVVSVLLVGFSATPSDGSTVQAKATATTRKASSKSTTKTTSKSTAQKASSAASATSKPKPTAPKPLSARTAVKQWDSIAPDEWPSEAGSITARATARSIEVFRTPGDRTGVLAFIAGRSVAGPVHFLALGMVGDWVRVAIPLRPNGTVGWVRRSDVLLIDNSYRVVIDLGSNRMKVYDGTTVLVDASVASGTGGTPTPTGLFFLKELVPQSPSGALGPYAFGLSGYSDVLTTFNGGEGTIGIHGTNNPGKLGTNVSHGCVRVDNSSIVTMAKKLPLGTPVEVLNSPGDAPVNRKTTEWTSGGAAVPAAQAPTAVVDAPAETTPGTTTPSGSAAATGGTTLIETTTDETTTVPPTTTSSPTNVSPVQAVTPTTPVS